MKMWHWSLTLEHSQKSEPNHSVSRKDKCKSLIWNGKELTSNLHQLLVLLAKQRKRLKCFSLSVPLTSQRARFDLWFCDTSGHSWIWSSWHSVKHQQSKDLQVVGSTVSRGLRAHSVLWNWHRWNRSRTVEGLFPKPSGPQFFGYNKRVFQENSHLVSLIISITRLRAAEWREVWGRNRLEFKIELQRYPSGYSLFGVSLNLHWIKFDIPSQISFEWSQESHMFSRSLRWTWSAWSACRQNTALRRTRRQSGGCLGEKKKRISRR